MSFPAGVLKPGWRVSAVVRAAAFGLFVLAAAWAVGCARPIPPPPVSPPAPSPAPPPAAERLFRAVPTNEALDLALRMDPSAQGLGSWADARPAVERSLKFASFKPPAQQAAPASGTGVTWGQTVEGLKLLLALLPRLDREPELLAERFRWLEMTPSPLMTGYYLPDVQASLEPGPDYPYPLYGMPGDLRQLDLGRFHPRWKGQRLTYRMEDGAPVPYYSRAEIDFQEALAGRDLELAWARDLYDVVNLQIQGSGVLILPDGSRRRVGYAGGNGRVFKGTGPSLRARGWLLDKGLSIENMRAFLREHPDKAQEALADNKSYVFFRFKEGEAVGALGRPLTPMLSVAADPAVAPLGSLFFLSASVSADGNGGLRRLDGPVLFQDTGAAIKNRRVDFFFGEGDRAGNQAMRTNGPVRLFLLLPRQGGEAEGKGS